MPVSTLFLVFIAIVGYAMRVGFITKWSVGKFKILFLRFIEIHLVMYFSSLFYEWDFSIQK